MDRSALYLYYCYMAMKIHVFTPIYEFITAFAKCLSKECEDTSSSHTSLTHNPTTPQDCNSTPKDLTVGAQVLRVNE